MLFIYNYWSFWAVANNIQYLFNILQEQRV